MATSHNRYTRVHVPVAKYISRPRPTSGRRPFRQSRHSASKCTIQQRLHFYCTDIISTQAALILRTKEPVPPRALSKGPSSTARRTGPLINRIIPLYHSTGNTGQKNHSNAESVAAVLTPTSVTMNVRCPGIQPSHALFAPGLHLCPMAVCQMPMTYSGTQQLGQPFLPRPSE